MCAPLQQPRGFASFAPGRQHGKHSSCHAEAASHIAEPEAPTTRIYNYVLGGFGEKEKKGRLATDVSSGPSLKKEKYRNYIGSSIIRHNTPSFKKVFVIFSNFIQI